MIRAVGIDPGTLSIDVCGIADGQIYLDRTWPTADALPDATADDLAGGKTRHLVDRLRVREARGTVLDSLVFISPEAARKRLGLQHV